MAARPTRLIALAAVVLAGSAAAAVPARPPQEAPAARRIVSLVPALTETLFALGAGDRLVAVSSFDNLPPDAAGLPRVGALLDPDVERILALRPDLVLTYGSQEELQAQLRRAGIGAYSYRHAGLSGVLDTIRDLGRLVGRRDAADRLARTVAGRIDAVRARVRGRPKLRTLLVFGRDPGTLRGLYASGGRGFLHEMLEAAGGANVFADADRESVQPSLETVLARAPEAVIEVRASGFGTAADVARERAAWGALTALPAVRWGRVHFLSGQHLVVPGPRVAEGTEAIARALHPEIRW